MTMRPGEPLDGGTRRPASAAPVALFLSLSLLLLAFFIVLTALSTTEEHRVRAVIGSLEQTFSDGPVTEGTPFTGRVGSVVGLRKSFEADLARMVETEVPAAEVRQTAAGGVTEVVMRADALFDLQGTDLRRPRHAFLDRLVAALSAAPPGVALTMEFTLGSDYDSSKRDGVAEDVRGGGGVPGDLSLQRSRVVSMARVLLARGAPPTAFAVGLEPGLGAWARLRFRAVEVSAPAGGDGTG